MVGRMKIKKSLPDVFPDVVRIEVVGKCNFKCIHCPTGVEPNNRQLLTEDNFNLIVNQFISSSFIPRVVVLYHGGEPLLNKKLSIFIGILKDIGVKKTVITTNASLLTPLRSRELIEAGLDEIKISFDGDSPEENDFIRREGDFYSNAKNVEFFCDICRKLDKKINIIISNVKILNQEKLSFFLKNTTDYMLDPTGYLVDYFSNYLDMIDIKSYPAMIWPGYQCYGELGYIEEPTKNITYCNKLFETTTILSNGNVVLCCYDLAGEVILGNIYINNIFDIWNNDLYSGLRHRFKNNEYCNLCSKCVEISPRYLYKV